MISTLTFILILATAGFLIGLGLVGINLFRGKWIKSGSVILIVGIVGFIATGLLMMDQGEDNGRDNCIHNLNGKVVGQSCIVGSDWKEITSF